MSHFQTRVTPRNTPGRWAGKVVNLYRRKRAAWFPDSTAQRFVCPLCRFSGPFVAVGKPPRLHAQCPSCGCYERHRLQKLVLDRLAPQLPPAARCLQFAPDPMTPWLRRLCGEVVTAEYAPGKAMLRLDMRRIELPDASFDLVYASHVLEHIIEDMDALREVARILRPGGWAVLPVPVIAERTVEYPAPQPTERYHVRAPGWDYFDRYRQVFASVELFRTEDFADRQQHQLWVYEDRTIYPNAIARYRPAMPGRRHADVVPVCRKAA